MGRTGETQIILYSRKEDNERMHSLRTNRQDETGSDQVFVNIVRIKKKRERKKEFVEALMLFVTSLDWCHVEKLFRMTI